MTIDPNEFIDQGPPLPEMQKRPSEWIGEYAGLQSEKWMDQTPEERAQTFMAATIAYLDACWMEQHFNCGHFGDDDPMATT